MKSFERWILEEGPGGSRLRLEQKKNAGVNLAFGIGIVAVGGWMLTRPDIAGFAKWVIGFGVFWVTFSLLAGREVRTVRLGGDHIVMEGKGGKVRDTWARDRPVALTIRKKRRERRKKGGVPLPWRVALVDHEGARFRAELRFQEEETARALAEELAGRLGIEVRNEGEGV